MLPAVGLGGHHHHQISFEDLCFGSSFDGLARDLPTPVAHHSTQLPEGKGSIAMTNPSLVPRRAHQTTGRMLPDLIADSYDDTTVVLGGAHSAAVRGVAARSFTPPLDVYLADTRAAKYMSGIGLQAVTAEPNITVHSIASSQWDRLATSRTVNLVVAYLDLMESGDRAAAEVYRELRLSRR